MSLFDVPGNVHPSTYDWKKDFGGLALSTRQSRIFYIELDVSRVLGLAQYAEELENQVRGLRQRDMVTVKLEVHEQDLKKIEKLEAEIVALKKKVGELQPNQKAVTEKKKPGPKKKSEDLF
jgi:hypothetical protein